MICGSGEQLGVISRPPLDAVSPPLLPTDRTLLMLSPTSLCFDEFGLMEMFSLAQMSENLHITFTCCIAFSGRKCYLHAFVAYVFFMMLPLAEDEGNFFSMLKEDAATRQHEEASR